jgi:hypothetical protein
VGPYAFSPQLLRSRCNDALNGAIKPPSGENGRDGEASTFLAEGGASRPQLFSKLVGSDTVLMREIYICTLKEVDEPVHH